MATYPWLLLNAMALPIELVRPETNPYPLPIALIAGSFPLAALIMVFGMLRITRAGDGIDRLAPGAMYSMAFDRGGLWARQREGSRLAAIGWLLDLHPRHLLVPLAGLALFVAVSPSRTLDTALLVPLAALSGLVGGRVILAAHAFVLHLGRRLLGLPTTADDDAS